MYGLNDDVTWVEGPVLSGCFDWVVDMCKVSCASGAAIYGWVGNLIG